MADLLTTYDRRLLEWLGKMHAPVPTSDLAFIIGRQPGKESNRKHSAYVLGLLCNLEVFKLVKREVYGPPIKWVITDAGRAAAAMAPADVAPGAGGGGR